MDCGGGRILFLTWESVIHFKNRARIKYYFNDLRIAFAESRCIFIFGSVLLMNVFTSVSFTLSPDFSKRSTADSWSFIIISMKALSKAFPAFLPRSSAFFLLSALIESGRVTFRWLASILTWSLAAE